MKFHKKSGSKDLDSNSVNLNLDKPKNKNPKKHRVLKIFLVLLALAVLAGGAFAAKTITTINKVIKHQGGISADGLKGELDLSKLKGEGEGRVNILLLGVGDVGHAGEGLTDTILVASVDPKTYDVVMISIPRDLYVKIPGFWWSKINAANAFAEQAKEDSGPEVIKKTVSDVLDMPIHYYLRIDFTGLKKSVDSLGGVDINNPAALSDPDYPCDKNERYSCGFNLKAGNFHMDGALALKFARCRKGTCGDDYGRAKRQQTVLVAMRDQALKLGNILNPAKINDLLGIVGDHLRTDISLEEMQRLVTIGRKINSNTIINKVLENEEEGLVKNSNIGDSSIVIPTAGVGNYRAIQSYVRSLLIDGYIKSEAAKVEIISDGARPGRVYALSVLLKSLGYNVIKTTVITEPSDGKTKIIDFTNGNKAYTAKYLENRLKVVVDRQVAGPASQTEIKIILGADYEFKNSL